MADWLPVAQSTRCQMKHVESGAEQISTHRQFDSVCQPLRQVLIIGGWLQGTPAEKIHVEPNVQECRVLPMVDRPFRFAVLEDV